MTKLLWSLRSPSIDHAEITLVTDTDDEPVNRAALKAFARMLNALVAIMENLMSPLIALPLMRRDLIRSTFISWFSIKTQHADVGRSAPMLFNLSSCR
jgi:hypothetical protein